MESLLAQKGLQVRRGGMPGGIHRVDAQPVQSQVLDNIHAMFRNGFTVDHERMLYESIANAIIIIAKSESQLGIPDPVPPERL